TSGVIGMPTRDQPSLPDLARSRAARPRRSPVPLSRILATFGTAAEGGRTIPDIYRDEVAPIRTRTIRLLGRKNPSALLHTFLGYEVKASYKRLHCPDLVTARYLRLFSELGCRAIKLPYDPTVTARLLPELEGAVERLAASVRELYPSDRELQLYVTRSIYAL